MKTLFLTAILLLIITPINEAQVLHENWVPVKYDTNSIIYLNTVGLSNFRGNDIYVWILEHNDPPIEIEMIDKKIHKTKSYILINKDLYRYGILQMIFFDKDDDVIKSYNYERNTDIDELKYNSPILENSAIEVILKKCIELIDESKSED